MTNALVAYLINLRNRSPKPWNGIRIKQNTVIQLFRSEADLNDWEGTLTVDELVDTLESLPQGYFVRIQTSVQDAGFGMKTVPGEDAFEFFDKQSM